MRPFMFVIRSTPLPENRNYGKIAGAFVHVWVISTDLSSAQEIAYTFIRHYLWTPEEIEHAFEIEPEQISSLHKDEIALYRQALKFGVAADFVGWLADEGKSGDPVLLWRP